MIEASEVRRISSVGERIVVIRQPVAAAEYFFHVRKQSFPHAYGGFEFLGLDAVINNVASPLASERIWYSVYQGVARLPSLLEILKTKSDPHAEGGSCDIMVAFVKSFGPQSHLRSRM